MEIARRSGHTRFPLCESDHDHVVGLVHIKDVFRLDTGTKIDDIKRNIMLVPEGMSLDRLLREFQKNHQHMALVVDEYGGTAGIVTMENVLEELVGQIQDEFDEEVPQVTPEKEGSYLVDGRMLLEDAADMFDLPVGDQEEYDTLGGFVFGKLGKRPRVGDIVELPEHRLRVVEVKGLRIRQVQVSLKKQAGQAV